MNFRRGMNRLGFGLGFLAATLHAVQGIRALMRSREAGYAVGLDWAVRTTGVECLCVWALVWLVMVVLGWALDGFRTKSN